MKKTTKKLFLIETFCFDMSEHIEVDWEKVLKIICKHFLANDLVTYKEIKRMREDCAALAGDGITYTNDGRQSYT